MHLNTDPVFTFSKVKTGIPGFDEISRGGLPQGRPSLLVGSAGTGKTTLAMQFLFNGARDYNENGVLFTFEEKRDDLISNMNNFGWNLQPILEKKGVIIDEILLDPMEVQAAGAYNLEGLFIRMESQIKKNGAKRIVIDSMEGLFQYIPSERILRAELKRMFQWIRDNEISAIITAGAGNMQITRYGIEEYLSDCVILLNSRLIDQVPSRRLRILKYRGSAHGENEYPFLIDKKGIYIFPITSLSLDFKVLNQRIKTGVDRLDKMFGGKGFYKGSSILISGTSGTGKTTLTNTIMKAACDREEKSKFISHKEDLAIRIKNAELQEQILVKNRKIIGEIRGRDK